MLAMAASVSAAKESQERSQLGGLPPRIRTAKDDVRGWGQETRLHAPPPLRAPAANYLGKGGDAWVMPLPRQSTHINTSCIFKLREGKQAGVTTHATFSQLQSLRVMVNTFSIPQSLSMS